MRASTIVFAAALGLSACANPTEPDAGTAPTDTGVRDAASSIDAGLDAAADVGPNEDAEILDGTATDATATDASDAEVDAGDVGDVGCQYPALMVDGPFPPGPPPPSAHLLVTDTSSNSIFKVDLGGAVLAQWPSHIVGVYGVEHDRRNPNGFFVSGHPIIGQNGANKPFRRISFSGVVTATITYSEQIPSGVDGLDFAFGSTPADDVLVFALVNRNNFQTISGAHASDGTRWFEGGDELMRWKGVSVERYACDTADSLVFWATRPNELSLRDWPTDTELRFYSLPTNDARGVTRTPYGDFYVVDGEQRRVLHLDATGNLIGSFATPGPNPADVSYGE